jgi:signal transduction histidine kinase
MKRRIWIELFVPTMVLGVAWLALSLATTFYMGWMERENRRILDENVASLRAVSVMQACVVNWQAMVVDQAAKQPLELPLSNADNLLKDFRSALSEASANAFSPDERRIVDRIEKLFVEIEDDFTRRQSEPPVLASLNVATAKALLLTELCGQLRTHNEEIIQRAATDLDWWRRRVMTARLLITTLGPLLGIGLGYYISSRTQRRLAEIHVRLVGAAHDSKPWLVAPTSADGSLDAIDDQVRRVAARIEEVLSELAGMRREATRVDRLVAVGQLAAGVAHELRNPLTAVKLLVQTAVQRSRDGARPSSLVVALDEIARMENTIQSLLDYARPSAERRERSDLRDILRSAANLVQGRADQCSARVELDCREAPILLHCDSEQIRQVFVNLFLNGLDAMESGGVLSVFATLRTDPELGGVASVAVSDTGQGIPPDLVDRIFEPFVTTKPRGTGLGLAICRRLVEAHGGRLWAENQVSGGARITVVLPNVAPAVNPSEVATASQSECPEAAGGTRLRTARLDS